MPAPRSISVSLTASIARYHGVLQGDERNDFTRSLDAGLDTRVTVLAATVSASMWLSPRWGAAVSLPYESRDLLNATFPAQGGGGERRHDNVTGVGDSIVEGRLLAAGASSESRTRVIVGLGFSLPTGPTRPDPLVGPTDATLQLGSGVVAPVVAAEGVALLPGGARLRLDGVLRYPVYANRFEYQGGPNLGYTSSYDRLLGSRVAVGAGIYGSERGHDARRGFRIDNSGGRTVGARLSVSVAFGSWALSAEGRLPVYRYVDVVQIAEELGAAAAVTYQSVRLF